MVMKAAYIRFFCALLGLAAYAVARATPPAPAWADVVVTFAGQSFGFAGPLRWFDATDAGGRIGFEIRSLATPGFTPRPTIETARLRTPGNRWQIVTFGGRAPQAMEGTCAVESFTTFDDGVRVQHVFLNCADLDT